MDVTQSHEPVHQPVQAPVQEPQAHQQHQQHPIGLYVKVWIALFVLSTMSYLVDYYQFHGLLRWGLIIMLMLIKAGLIVAVFMHMAWERLALACAILLPPLCLLVLVALMAIEADQMLLTHGLFFR